MKKIVIAILAALAIAVFIYFDLGTYLTLSSLKAQQAGLDARYQAAPLLVIAAFFLI